MRIFYLKKKGCEGVYGFPIFFGDLAGKMMAEMVIWRCRQESLKEWREATRRGNEKEEKERNEKKGADQRDKGEF